MLFIRTQRKEDSGEYRAQDDGKSIHRTGVPRYRRRTSAPATRGDSCECTSNPLDDHTRWMLDTPRSGFGPWII